MERLYEISALIGFASSSSTILKLGERDKTGDCVMVPVEWMELLLRHAEEAEEELSKLITQK